MDASLSLGAQIVVLLILAIPIACVSWTVTHEEVFHEPRDWCLKKSETSRLLLQRKFFYLFTCEYCFSHYVTIGFLVLTRFTLLYADWRGYLMEAVLTLGLVSVGYQSSVAITRLQPISSPGVTLRRSPGSSIALLIWRRPIERNVPRSHVCRVIAAAPSSWNARIDIRSSRCTNGKRSNKRLARSL